MSPQRHSLSGAILDFDGVIADTSGPHSAAFAAVCLRHGLRMPDYGALAGMRTPEAFEKILRESAREIAPDLVAALTAEKRAEFLRLLGDPASGGVIHEDARRFIRDLAATVPLGLATGAASSNVRFILAQSRLSGVFCRVVTADDVRHGKPHPETYERFRGDDRFPMRSTVVFEDSEAGFRSATAAGYPCCLVRSSFVLPESGSCAGCFDTFDSVPRSWFAGKEAVPSP
jgi:beta-phosphoglucomutase-like phosphatase (HAD superfamily)